MKTFISEPGLGSVSPATPNVANLSHPEMLVATLQRADGRLPVSLDEDIRSEPVGRSMAVALQAWNSIRCPSNLERLPQPLSTSI